MTAPRSIWLQRAGAYALFEFLPHNRVRMSVYLNQKERFTRTSSTIEAAKIEANLRAQSFVTLTADNAAAQGMSPILLRDMIYRA